VSSPGESVQIDKTDIEKKIEKRSCLCHCKVAKISDAMKLNCSKAWRKTVRVVVTGDRKFNGIFGEN
jgi:hypothetical protein